MTPSCVVRSSATAVTFSPPAMTASGPPSRPHATAAEAAIDAQQQLTEDARITFAVRMGLHTGEVVHRDEDYLGSDVNRAARLVALAHGGQILVSETTEILLRNAVALRPLGRASPPRAARTDVGTPDRRRRTANRVPGSAQRGLLRREPAPAAQLPHRTRGPRSRRRRAGAVRATGHAERGGRRRQDSPRSRSGRRTVGRVPRGRLDGRAGRGRRRGVGPGRDRDRAGHHPGRATRRSSTWSPRRWPAGVCCWSSTTASTFSRRWRRQSGRSSRARTVSGCSPRHVSTSR